MTESLTTQVQSNFVEPHFIEELGEEGLTLHEIAKSLQIEFKHIREKLVDRKHIEKLNIVKLQYAAIATYNENNKLIDSFAFSVDAAKFIVAKYDNELGDSYTAFLIQCEKTLREINKKVLSNPIRIPTHILNYFS